MDVLEYYMESKKEVSASISSNGVDKMSVTSFDGLGIRRYEGGRLSVAGLVGDDVAEIGSYVESGDLNKLREISISRYSGCDAQTGVAYASGPRVGAPSMDDSETGQPDEVESPSLLDDARLLSDLLRERHPDIHVFNKVKRVSHGLRILNEVGLSKGCTVSYTEVELLFKAKNSSSIFDGCFDFRTYQNSIGGSEVAMSHFDTILSAFGNRMSLSGGTYKVIFMDDDYTLMKKFMLELSGRAFARGTSVFSGEGGESRRFSENLNVVFARDTKSYNTPFDPTGCEAGRVNLIENGIFKRPYCDRETAYAFGLDDTASAFGTYDSVPGFGYMGLRLEDTRDADSVSKSLLEGTSILVHTSGGGDFGGDGRLSVPIQLGFVLEDGVVVGSVSSMVFKSDFESMFGKDFLGIVPHELFSFAGKGFAVFEGHVGNI